MGDSAWLPQIDQALCTGCGKCVETCPTGALGQITLPDGQVKAALVRPDLCTYCTLCEDLCPVDAIALPFLILSQEAYEAENLSRKEREDDKAHEVSPPSGDAGAGADAGGLLA